MLISTNTSKGKHISFELFWTTRCCRKWKKGNNILLSLQKNHMIWYIRCFGKWKKGLFDFSNSTFQLFDFSAFWLFEIQYEAFPLFNFSKFFLRTSDWKRMFPTQDLGTRGGITEGHGGMQQDEGLLYWPWSAGAKPSSSSGKGLPFHKRDKSTGTSKAVASSLVMKITNQDRCHLDDVHWDWEK